MVQFEYGKYNRISVRLQVLSANKLLLNINYPLINLQSQIISSNMHTLTPTQRNTLLVDPLLSEDTQNYHEYLANSFSPLQSQVFTTPTRTRQLSLYQDSECQLIRNAQNQQLPITRTRLQQMNRKQRSIRSAHYRQNSQEIPKKQPALGQNWNVKGKTLSISTMKTVSTRLVSSAHGVRSQGRLKDKNNYLSSVGFNKKSRPQSPSSTPTKIVQQFDIRNKRPHVIYPFQTKLKIKRVDDNPRVLETIIAKKSKVMERGQLYSYVTKLATRRFQ